MAINDKGNIIAGPAYVWVAPVGEALPDPTTITAGMAWGGNWKQLGYTNGPVQYQMQTEQYDLYVEQLTPPVRSTRVQVAATITGELAEFIGENLALATDGTLTKHPASASSVGYDEVVVRADNADISLYAVGVEGIRLHSLGDKLPVRMFAARASVVLSGAIQFAKRAATGIPITITAYADDVNQLTTWHNVMEPKV